MSTAYESKLFRSETEPRIVEDAIALDLDRTLLKTGAVTDLLLDSLVNYGVSSDVVAAAKKHVDGQSGNSFDLFEYISC